MNELEVRARRLEVLWSRQVETAVLRVFREGLSIRDEISCLKESSTVVSKWRFLCFSFFSYLCQKSECPNFTSNVQFSTNSLVVLKKWLLDNELSGKWIKEREELIFSRKLCLILTNVLINCPCFVCAPALWSVRFIEATDWFCVMSDSFIFRCLWCWLFRYMYYHVIIELVCYSNVKLLFTAKR